jgi:hypothetical protein
MWAQWVAGRLASPTLQPLVTLSKRQWKGIQVLEMVVASLDGRSAMWLGQQANTW